MGPVDPLKYATGYHAPVLCNTVVEILITDPAGTYVDCTLGGGGHSHALLDVLAPEATVIGIDRDPEAIREARRRLSADVDSGRFVTVNGNFADLTEIARATEFSDVDGILFDFGVSSHQLDIPERGFSYRDSGGLDMRMGDDTNLTASEIVNSWSYEDLRSVLYEYGEESRAGLIARDIVAARPINDTVQLAEVVRRRVRGPNAPKVLSRIFQALRVRVNDELTAIRRALVATVSLLKPGGRCLAMSYHSLEDRIVKRFFRYGNFEGVAQKDFYGNVLTPWEVLTRRPLTADDEEIEANPRARSVRIRAAQRLATEATPTTH
ncbi:MAG: 16S rRNA (cytosine(1402)-N(4))-methyltransferase RsmH [Rhodothermales bacterium]|nr:16S rRNA (cytosine(1402)-N(4))-methyltransferase RsmH [Rhodothermales bacterium]